MGKEVVAMLLAGGQGSRLGILTEQVAKPAVPYGGKYRIIDFPLSNCTNSDIDTVGVLTQYKPLELNSYIGSGASWDLDRMNGGVFILPPYMKGKSGEWYKGTANAIYQNMSFIEQYDPEYVVVLSGDHIYKMDYSAMVNFHKKKGASVTIAVIEVPWDEAPRFGILNTLDDMRIEEFEEKPKKPRSNKASMGVYVFTWSLLREYLIRDEADPKSSKDFGKNVIPAMLAENEPMYAYPFRGYWKDVGTVESLWEANMDLLDLNPELDLHDGTWRIYSKTPVLSPHYIAEGAQIKNSLIAEGCTIRGDIRHSVLFASVDVDEGTKVVDSVIMPDTVVGRGASIHRAIIAPKAHIQPGAVVGEPGSDKIAVIGEGVTVYSGTVVKAGEMLDQAGAKALLEGAKEEGGGKDA